MELTSQPARCSSATLLLEIPVNLYKCRFAMQLHSEQGYKLALVSAWLGS